MNNVVLMGRLTKDPELTTARSGTKIADYTLAVERRNGFDYVPCVTFGKGAEFAEKHLKQGTSVLVTGRIQNKRYWDSDGKTFYTLDVVIEKHELLYNKCRNVDMDLIIEEASGLVGQPCD